MSSLLIGCILEITRIILIEKLRDTPYLKSEDFADIKIVKQKILFIGNNEDIKKINKIIFIKKWSLIPLTTTCLITGILYLMGVL